MPRIRVPVSVRKRLVRLEGIKPNDLPAGGWPALMALEEWEAVAAEQQDALMDSTHDDIGRRAVSEPEAPPLVAQPKGPTRAQRDFEVTQQYLRSEQERRAQQTQDRLPLTAY